jgi:hypothetical protein
MRIVLASALVAVLVWSALVAQGKETPPPPNSGVPRSLQKEDYNSLPDPENPKDAARLRCSACITAVQEVNKRLETVHKSFAKTPEKLKRYHVIAAVDELCPTEVWHYGLLRNLQTKDVYAKFVDENDKEFKHTTVKGGWITKLWGKHCDEFMERVEDHLWDLYHGKEMDLCPFCQPIFEEEKKLKEAEEKAKSATNAETASTPKKDGDL